MPSAIRRSQSSTILSIAAHALVLALVLFVSHRTYRVITQSGGKAVYTGIQVAGGSHATPRCRCVC